MYPIAAERVESFVIDVPASTVTAVPFVKTMSFANGYLIGVEIGIPPGHGGLSGIRLLQGGTQMLPATANQYIVGDDEIIRWPLDGFHETGRWSAHTYNTDTIDHPFYVRFLLVEVVRREDFVAPPLMPLPL